MEKKNKNTLQTKPNKSQKFLTSVLQTPEKASLKPSKTWRQIKKNKPLHLSHNLCVLKLPELTMLPFPKALMQELSSFQWKKPKCREVNVNKTDTSQLAKKELASSNYKTSFLGLQLVD